MSDKLSKASLSAAAALAASAGAVDVARAADVAAPNVAKSNPLTVTVVGGVVLSDFSSNSFFNDYGSYKLGLDTGRDIGGFGSISIGRAFDAGSPFDWRIAGSVTEFLDNNREENIGYYGGSYAAGLHDAADWQHFDMEIGHTTSTETSTLRVGLGARVTHLKNSSSFDASVGYYGLSVNENIGGENEFLGGGPRASIEGRFGGTLGVEFAASVAALFGEQSSNLGYAANYGYFGSELPIFDVGATSKDWRWLSDMEVSGGVSYKPSNSVSLSAGYRYERISNIGTELTTDAVTSSGPYVKAAIKF